MKHCLLVVVVLMVVLGMFKAAVFKYIIHYNDEALSFTNFVKVFLLGTKQVLELFIQPLTLLRSGCPELNSSMTPRGQICQESEADP